MWHCVDGGDFGSLVDANNAYTVPKLVLFNVTSNDALLHPRCDIDIYLNFCDGSGTAVWVSGNNWEFYDDGGVYPGGVAKTTSQLGLWLIGTPQNGDYVRFDVGVLTEVKDVEVRWNMPDKPCGCGYAISRSLVCDIHTSTTIPLGAKLVLIAGSTDGDNLYPYSFGSTSPKDLLNSKCGEFFIYSRDIQDGNDPDHPTVKWISVECYDAIGWFANRTIAGVVPYPGSSPIHTFVDEIAKFMGVAISKHMRLVSSWSVTVSGSIPLTTIREYLGAIAKLHVGNFVISAKGELDLVSPCWAYMGSAVTSTLTPYGDKVMDIDGVNYTTQTSTVETYGNAMVLEKMEAGETGYFSGVYASYNGTIYTAGDSSGLVYVIEENPFVSQTIVDTIYAELSSPLWYTGYAAYDFVMNPQAELGIDLLTINGYISAESVACARLNFSTGLADVWNPMVSESSKEVYTM